MNFSLTSVAREIVWVQKKLLVEMTDGSLQEYTCHLNPFELYPGKEAERVFLNKTHEQLVEKCRDLNTIYAEMHRPMGKFTAMLNGLAYNGDSIASHRGWGTYR